PHTSVAALASIASHRTFVTMANAPHLPRDGRSYADDLLSKLSRIFLQKGLDRFLVICPSCQLVAGRCMKLRLRAKQISSQSVGWAKRSLPTLEKLTR
ncbi:hypothetical protein, partial [Bradyrhizobium sp. AUGA SZCCT0283]|uniref:hypothetical protein n=1 Tax=Bradyrhizobium sp. AUGA SZCCT0283 TaxID=2807671 RepID=UPI001BA58ABA